MVDKILSAAIAVVVILFLIELAVSGEKHPATIEAIRTEKGLSVSNNTTRSYEQDVAYFDNRSAILTYHDSEHFTEGDSIEYALTPIVKNLRSMTNLKTGYKITVHTYTSLIALIIASVVGQGLNLGIQWSNKDMIRLLLFCLLFTIGYIFIFK